MGFVEQGLSDVGNAIEGGAKDVANAVGGAADSVYNAAKNGIEDLAAKTSPTPQVNSQPKPPVQPHQWTAPDVSGNGQVTVHHGALTDAADIIKQCVPELESAIKKVAQHTGAFDSLMTWTTGQNFGGNMAAAVDAFQKAGTNTSQDHQDTVTKLKSTHQQYSDNESSIANNASQIPSGGSASSGSSSSSSGSSSGGTAGSWS